MSALHIGIVGGGAFGTALACLGRRAGRRVTLWSRDAAQALTTAPMLRFDRRDQMQARWARQVHGVEIAPPVHWAPSTQGDDPLRVAVGSPRSASNSALPTPGWPKPRSCG